MLFAFLLGGITGTSELEKFVGEVAIGVRHGGGERAGGGRNKGNAAPEPGSNLPWESPRRTRL